MTTIATAVNEGAVIDFALATTDAQVAAYCKAQGGLASGGARRQALGGSSTGRTAMTEAQ